MEDTKNEKIQIKIPEIKYEIRDKKKVVFYPIQVTKGSQTWEVSHRYSEFDMLRVNLGVTHGNIPPIPKKSFFALKKQEDLDARRVGLELFLKNCMGRQDLFSNPELIKFLQLHNYAPEQRLNHMGLLGYLSHEKLGFRDFVFHKDYVFTVTGQMNIIDRLDAGLVNIKMPWDGKMPKNTLLLPVGSLEVWSRFEEAGVDFVYRRGFSKRFDSQIICLEMCEKLKMVFAGCDNGYIYGLSFEGLKKVSGEDGKERIGGIEQVFEDDVHRKRVMGLKVDTGNRLLYSIGEDGFLNVVNLSTNTVACELKVTESKLTCLELDEDAESIFLTDREGKIHLYNTTELPPLKNQTISLGIQSSIRGLDVDFSSGKIFVSTFEDGYVWEYKAKLPLTATPDKLQIKRVGKSKAYDNPRNVYYWKERKELYVGYAGGKMCVFKAGNLGASAIYSVKAHEGDITGIKRSTKKILITCSKDRCIKFWVPPNTWNQSEKDFNRKKKEVEEDAKSVSSNDSIIEVRKKPRLGSDDEDETDNITLEKQIEETIEGYEAEKKEAEKPKKRKFYGDSSSEDDSD